MPARKRVRSYLADASPHRPEPWSIRVCGSLRVLSMLGALVMLGVAGMAQAQDLSAPAPTPEATPAPAPAALNLRLTPRLQEDLSPEVQHTLPSFVSGDVLNSQTDLLTTVQGHAQWRRGTTLIRADEIQYYQPDDEARASGQVYINQAGNVYQGRELQLKLDAFEGFFTQPSYQFLRNQAHGQAQRVDFVGEDHVVIHNGNYTTCRREPGPDWMPAWMLSAQTMTLNQEEETGNAQNATLEFYGHPVVRVPSLNFPLNDARHSGLLPPTFGVSSRDGTEYTQPYYWNIAPNRDMTIYPTWMTKRGVNLASEFRYLESDYQGKVWANYMPDDRLVGRSRWGYSLQHGGVLDTGVNGLNQVGLGMNLNRVSDDQYWSDFTRAMPNTMTQRLMPNDVSLGWGRQDFSANLRTLKWQTLQDISAPIVPPYDRWPQVVGRYNKSNFWRGLDVSLETDYTYFRADPTLMRQPNGQRVFGFAQLSYPFMAPGWFVTPKLGLRATRYEFDQSLQDGRTSASVNVPTFSLDSGLIFERDTSFFGRAFRQTLEPRLFYVNTPYREQNSLPNYDSGLTDFNFTTIFSENAFAGNDRIADTHSITAALGTRFLAPETGAELGRFGVAQRYRFRDERVTLPGHSVAQGGTSDFLVGAGVNLDTRWSLDSLVDFSFEKDRTMASSITGRYSPTNYRTVSATYLFHRDSSEQLDLGWQWPLNDLWGDKGRDTGPGQGLGPNRWYGVGRVNYSMLDKRLVKAIAGLEYDADCWIGRVVLMRDSNNVQRSNTQLLFQIELVGFSRLGSSPLNTLRQSVPRYQYLREQITTPNRFSNYD